LIVEFAAAKLEAGQALMDAIIEGAGQRLRPIIMISLTKPARLAATTAPIRPKGITSMTETGIDQLS
jgi:multidrug efflux pump subunit AcrB